MTLDIDKIKHALEMARDFHDKDSKMYAALSDAIGHIPNDAKSVGMREALAGLNDAVDLYWNDGRTDGQVKNINYWQLRAKQALASQPSPAATIEPDDITGALNARQAAINESMARPGSSVGGATERGKAIVEEAWRQTCAGPGEFDDYAVQLIAAALTPLFDELRAFCRPILGDVGSANDRAFERIIARMGGARAATVETDWQIMYEAETRISAKQAAEIVQLREQLKADPRSSADIGVLASVIEIEQMIRIEFPSNPIAARHAAERVHRFLDARYSLRAKTLARQTTASGLPHCEGQAVECDGGLHTSTEPQAVKVPANTEALRDALERVIGHDASRGSLTYDSVAQLIASAANAARHALDILDTQAARETYTEICMNEKCPRGCGSPVEVVRSTVTRPESK